MSKIFYFILFLFLINVEAVTKWKYQYQFELKKDQIAKILISYRDKNTFLRNGEFDFRWTLYKAGALIVFSTFQTVKSQRVLYLGYRLNSYEVKLLPRGSLLSDRIYLTVVFNNFNKKSRVAKIDMFIKDDNSKILADFIDPNKEMNAK